MGSRAKTILSRCWTILPLALTSGGCVKPAMGNVEINRCAVERTSGGNQKAMQTSELVEQGNEYLDSALRDLEQPDFLDLQTVLQRSSDCFGRALRLAPDSYDAQLSMGVAHLARARLAREKTTERTSLLQGARRMLGRAYMLRQGAYEPLYYLAEVAVAEGDTAQARRLLEPLRIAGVKDGPVNMLLGYLSERDGKTDDARGFYRKAVAAGWPVETLTFAAARLASLQPRSWSP